LKELMLSWLLRDEAVLMVWWCGVVVDWCVGATEYQRS